MTDESNRRSRGRSERCDREDPKCLGSTVQREATVCNDAADSRAEQAQTDAEQLGLAPGETDWDSFLNIETKTALLEVAEANPYIPIAQRPEVLWTSSARVKSVRCTAYLAYKGDRESREKLKQWHARAMEKAEVASRRRGRSRAEPVGCTEEMRGRGRERNFVGDWYEWYKLAFELEQVLLGLYDFEWDEVMA